jgi:hypothetical protein
VHSWSKRQFESDDVNARVNKHRKGLTPERNVSGNVSGNVTVTPSDTDTDTDTPIVPKGDNGSNGHGKTDLKLFEQFYLAYPRKENPKGAKKAFLKLHLSENDVLGILKWLEEAKRSEQWQDKTLIPFPATFLNQERWKGEPPPRAASAQQQESKPTPAKVIWEYDDKGNKVRCRMA